MARVVQEIPEKPTRWKYPPEWLNGEIWELEPGVDIPEDVGSFRMHAFNVAAREYQLSVRVPVVDGKLYFQTYKAPEPRQSKWQELTDFVNSLDTKRLIVTLEDYEVSDGPE